MYWLVCFSDGSYGSKVCHFDVRGLFGVACLIIVVFDCFSVIMCSFLSAEFLVCPSRLFLFC